MVVVRLAALTLLLLTAASSQASFADTEFTQLIDDEGDHPLGYHDFATLSVGEPGDGTVVFRGTVGDIDQVPRDDATIMYFGFTSDVFTLGGTFYDGQLATRNVGKATAPDYCEKVASENAIYCAWSYERIATEVGMTLTNIWGFIDGCAARTGCLPMDTGPGSIANQGWNPSSTPYEWTLTGCTLKVRSSCPGAAPEAPEPVQLFTDVADASFHAEHAAPVTGSQQFNWTTEWTDVDFSLLGMVTNGSARLIIRDGGNNTQYDADLVGEVNATLQFLDATPGNWTFHFVLVDFVGDLSATLAAVTFDETGAAKPPSSSTTSTSTAQTTAADEEPQESVGDDAKVEESPGLPLVALLAAVVLAVLRRRQS